MLPGRRRIMKHVAKVIDLCIITIPFILSDIVLASGFGNHWPRGLTVASMLSRRIPLGQCFLFALFLGAAHCVFLLCGLYTSKRMASPPRANAAEICKAAVLTGSVLLIGRALQIEALRYEFTAVFILLLFLSLFLARCASRFWLMALRHQGASRRFVMIGGTNDRAIEFARHLSAHPEFGYEVVGFVDDDWIGLPNFERFGYQRCCDFEGLALFLRHNVVDEVAIYLPLQSYYQHAAQLVALCQEHGIAIRFGAQLFNLRNEQSDNEFDEHAQFLSVVMALQTGPALLKRLLDCAVSMLLLVLVAPLLIVVAALVKFSSPGPILFRQVRIGLNKRQFTMFKFRTMVANAEQLQDNYLSMNEMNGPAFKIKNDPRITTLGRFLRKTSIDELPQLFNVLMGDMSLVGPRAMSLRDYRLFNQDSHRRRFCVKPGITCLWQIMGRNSISFHQWMELDMQYIDKWSFWLDLKILAQTVPVVLRGSGAA
jgi:exopolysaccharide biosynthesis polyprenyl glycosylphosphotransferase